MNAQQTHPKRIELPTQFAVGPVNSYLFVEPEPILIDTGVATDDSWAALRVGIEAEGLTVQDIQKVIITHPHVDHFAQAHRFVSEANAQVWIADMGQQWLLDPYSMWQGRIDYYRNYFLPQVGVSPEVEQMVVMYFTAVQQGSPPVPQSNLSPFKVGDQLQMGGLAWDVLHMPGHASTQTCFYQAETRQFLSADMLLPKTPTPVVEQPPDGKTRVKSLPIFLNSLDVVEALDIDTVYPGHGEVFSNHRELIQKQRTRIHQRKDEAFTLVEAGYHTAFELVNIMYSSYPTQFRFAGLWMLVGYLDLLEAEERIEVATREDGVLLYTAV